MNGEVLKLWERQPKESEKAWEAFKFYRDLGEKRSLQEVSRQLSKHWSLLSRWAKKWRWRERAMAWDVECDRQLQKAQLKQITQIRKEHSDLAMLLKKKARKALKLADKIMAGIKTKEATLKDAVRLLDVARALVDTGAKLHALALGEPTEIEAEAKIPDMVVFKLHQEPPPEPEEDLNDASSENGV